MRTHARLLAAGLATASLIVAAGCSSGSTTSSESPTSSAASPSSTVGASATSEVLAEPSTGCSAATPVSPGETKQTLTAAGTSGWYFRHIPPSYTGAKPMPLILDLHGYGESAEIHTKISGLGRYGDTHGFLTLTPQVKGPVPLWDTDLQ